MKTINEEKNVLRWGGLSGILGSIILLIVFGIVIAFVGDDPAELEGFLKRFPSVRTARTVENSLYMLTLVMWVPHYLALYHALRKHSPASALFGSAFALIGLVILMAGAIPHIVTSRLSDLYHTPGVSPADQATLVLSWQVTLGIFEALLIQGLFIMPIALIILGAAMFRAPNFGKGFGGVSLVIGIAAAIAAVVLMIDSRSMIAAVGIFGLIIFHLVLGWKVYALSRNL